VNCVFSSRRGEGEGRAVDRKLVLLACASILLLSCVGVSFQFIEPVRAVTTWTVDDDGPADFSSIQEAINSPVVKDGDTIFVYNGTYYENVVVNKTVSLVGENKHTTIIDGGETGNVVCLRANNIKISGFTIRNSGTFDWDSGVYVSPLDWDTSVCVSRSSGNNISFNIVTNNENGIFIHESSKNTLTNNVVTANRVYGVHLWDTSNDILTDNTVSNNFDGIIIELCSNAILRNNTASGNMDNFGVGGVELSHFVHDIDTSNKVEGKSIRYLVNRKDIVIDSSWDVGYLCLVNSTNVTVKDLTLTVRNWHGIKFAYTKNSRIENVTISRTSYAIDFSYSSNNTIINNNILNQMGIRLDDSNGNAIINNSISNTWHAISFYSSSNNTITNNYVNNNRYGIWSYDSSDNKIYHNNFVENIQQAYDSSIECPEYPLSINIWDDGYPSGGNYWSDYTGLDVYSGLYQNATGSDGIGDTPYIIDENNQDIYPLMKPWRAVLGDLNNDGKVNIKDIAIWGLAFGSYPGHPRWNPNADLDNNQVINIIDGVKIAKDFGKTY